MALQPTTLIEYEDSKMSHFIYNDILNVFISLFESLHPN